MQVFPAQQPAWAKYLQLRFLTHYGSEPVCALNDVRVYGKSAVEDLEDRLALEAGQDGDDEQEQAQQEAVDAEAQSKPQPELEPEAAGNEAAGVSQPPKPEDNGDGTASDPSPTSMPAEDPTKPVAGSDVVGHGSAAQAGAEVSAGAADENKPAAETENGKPEDGSAAVSDVQGVSGDRGDVAAEVLEVLSAGLRRLISPPGTGKKRATYSGVATSIDRMPQPEAPIAPESAPPGNSGSAGAQRQDTGGREKSGDKDGAEAAPKASASKKELVGTVPVVVDTSGTQLPLISTTAVDSMPSALSACSSSAARGLSRQNHYHSCTGI